MGFYILNVSRAFGISKKKRVMSCKTRSNGGGEGRGLICHTDGSWQGEDTVYQPSHLSAHLCSFHHFTGVCVCVGVKYMTINLNENENGE